MIRKRFGVFGEDALRRPGDDRTRGTIEYRPAFGLDWDPVAFRLAATEAVGFVRSLAFDAPAAAFDSAFATDQ